MLMEYFCLFVFTFRLFHVWCFAAGVKFWSDKKNVFFLSMIVVRKHLLVGLGEFCFHITIPNHGCKIKMVAQFESLTPGFNTITPVT